MFLGLDLGTTNVKAVAVEPGGHIASVGSAPVERFHTPDGGIEQDIGQIWEAAQTAIRRATAQVDSSRILAVGVSSQGGAMQILDSSDAPVGRVISWLDSRGVSYDASLTEELGRDFFARRIGHMASGVAIGQLLRLKKDLPDLLKSSNRIGFVGDIVVGRLCGRRAHDPTSLAIAMLYNAWIKQADPEILARIGIEAKQLPCLLPATTAAGMLDETVAQSIGLPVGIPVSPAIHDQYAASLGAASISEGDVNFGAGTAWVLLANAGKLMLPATPDAFSCPHPVDKLYGQMLSMINGGSSIHWAMNLLGRQSADVQLVDQMLSAASPGAKGLRFWPFLSGGPRGNGSASLRGRLSGITLAHDPSHLIRAVVEGLACELFRHIRQLVEGGIRVDRLVMCGSAASGEHTPRIIAEVTRLPVCCVETPDISALGAAMLARSLAEPGMTLAEIARQWMPPRRTVSPESPSTVYGDLYEEYLSIFNH